MAEAHRKLQLAVSESIAQSLDLEAQLSGKDVIQLVREGIARVIIDASAVREVCASYPDGADVQMAHMIVASDGTTVKEFSINPFAILTGESYIHLETEYPEYR